MVVCNYMNIVLSDKNVYHWTSSNDIHFRGYLQDKTGRVYRANDAIHLLANVKDSQLLEKLLNDYYGSYSFIINKDGFRCAAVDIARSLPLFLSSDGSIISDSAELLRSKLGIARTDVDDFLMTSMTAMSFLIGNDTVYSHIKQLDLGQYVEVGKDTVSFNYYYRHLNEVKQKPIKDYFNQLTEAAYAAFARIKEAINNRPVVLSMSGGYDSRFVGCMLKNVGVNDVYCYSYGKAGNFEGIQAKKNAKALGFKWTFVEYDDSLVKKLLDEEGLKYLDSYETHDYSAYIQNYFAVRYLHEKGWFPENAVFLTGLCGDMPTGEYVIKEDQFKDFNINTASEHLYNLLFARYSMIDLYKKEYTQKIKQMLSMLPIEIKDYQSWTTATDAIYTGTSHIHAFMNMNHVHGFFGYEWLLPYWDKDILNVWYSIPAKYRYGQNLYADWLMEHICKPYGLNTRKTDIGYPESKWKRKVMYLGGSVIMFICLNLGIVFRRSYDFHGWAPLEVLLFKQLKKRGMIHYNKASITNLLVRYCFQRRYGADVVLKAQKNLRMPAI